MAKMDIEDVVYSIEGTGIRVTHTPTGKFIIVNTERSMFANKAHALALLREEVERV